MAELNEVYMVVPEAAIPTKTNQCLPMKGKVVYIHPKGRFAEGSILWRWQ